jgi:hypothetical protein
MARPQGSLPAAYYSAHLQGVPPPSLGASAPLGFYIMTPGLPTSYDQQSLASTFSTMTLQQPQSTN